MPSEEYIKKHTHKPRTRQQIQQPFEKPKKHIVPVDFLIKQPAVTPLIIRDHNTLDRISKIITEFIKHGR